MYISDRVCFIFLPWHWSCYNYFSFSSFIISKYSFKLYAIYLF